MKPQENVVVTCDGHTRFPSRKSRCARRKLDFYEFQIQSNRVKRISGPSNSTLTRRIDIRGPVHTTQEELENGGFTLKTHQMFSVHSTPEECKNATITGHFGFVFEENSVREIIWLSWRHRFRKAPFSKCFRSHENDRKAGIFKFLRLTSVFENPCFG